MTGQVLRLKYLCFLFLLVGLSGGKTDAQISREYDLKAAFIFNFSQYIEWQNGDPDTLYVCVLGSSPITAKLREIGRQHLFHNRHLLVREAQSLAEIKKCQMLFVSKASPVPVQEVVNAFSVRPTVLIGEEPGNALKGMNINFIVVDNKLRFEINMKTPNSSLIKFSSTMLKHALLVNN